MARKPDPRIVEILKKYHPDPDSALWDCHGTWVIYHKDVELMASRAGIEFGPPQIIEANSEKKIFSMVVSAKFGEEADWSTGEASPANNRNAYPMAMAEKRARDRVALKLLGLYGVYSDEEAESFKTDSLRAEGDAAAARGTLALRRFWDGLTADQKKSLGEEQKDAWKAQAAEMDTAA